MRPFGLARPFLAVMLMTLVTACAREPRPGSEPRDPKTPFAPAVVARNADVAGEARVDAVRPGGATGYGLTGAGVLVAQWDEGVARETHRDLLGRVTLGDGAGLSAHASHVSGTILGSGAGNGRALGVAPGARLLSRSFELDLVELGEMAPFVSVSNHAYGPALGWHRNPACPDEWSWTGGEGESVDGRFGRYDLVAATLDAIVRKADLLVVWAAGNERADQAPATARHPHFPSCEPDFSDEHGAERDLGHDTIGGGAIAKNVLSVGAVRDLPSVWNASDVVPLASSSFGPTDDGRVKPELVAGGDAVFSLSTSADDAYASASGTSSAAAVVTGVVALLVEQYRSEHAGRDPRAAELRALLVQTAVDTATPGPDTTTGFGLVDARAAADFIDADATAPRLRVGVSTGSAHEFVTEELAEGTPLRFTLAWLDPPGPARESANDPTPVLENDLDLSLAAPDGRTVFRPWSLDGERPGGAATRNGPNRVDTVEVIDVEAGENRWTGPWTLRVEPARPLARGEPQAYAIAASTPIPASAKPVAGSATRVELEVPPNGSASLSLPIENLGGGAFEWTASTDSPLLELERASGGPGDELVVRANVAELGDAPSGTATIELSSSEPGPPRIIGVRVVRACAPECGARLCGPDPACGTLCGRCSAGNACRSDGTCEPFAAGCPAAALGSVLGSAVATGATAGGSSLLASCGGETAPEAAFAWSAPRAGRYVFSTEGSAFDTLLSIRRGGCGGTEVACGDDTTDITSTVLVELEAGDAVTAVVDGFDGDFGDFSLGIHEVLCPDAELATRLGARLLPEASPGRLDRMRASCALEAAREVALGFTAPVEGLYRFDASASNYDASVAILAGDCSGEELACGADAVEVSLAEGARVIIVVDGAQRRDDRFALGITTRGLTCDGACDAAPNGGLCACDARCVELGDCCVDACGDCASCTANQDCEFGRCIPRRCTGNDCGCGPATGGTGAAGCDAGAGGTPGEGGVPAEEERSDAVAPSGCGCRASPASGPHALAWLGIALGVTALASRRARI
ncbi:MAG TPA: S8 family serine peptidase [Polyangiaceae bacterium]